MSSWIIIALLSILEKDGLKRTNDEMEKGLKYVGNYFSDNFINSITKFYWSKIFEIVSIRNFENETLRMYHLLLVYMESDVNTS